MGICSIKAVDSNTQNGGADAGWSRCGNGKVDSMTTRLSGHDDWPAQSRKSPTGWGHGKSADAVEWETLKWGRLGLQQPFARSNQSDYVTPTEAGKAFYAKHEHHSDKVR